MNLFTETKQYNKLKIHKHSSAWDLWRWSCHHD